MKLFIDNFRIWWQKPADATKRDTHREVSMLELFYDLVYVAIIIQLTHLVAGHVSSGSVLAYIATFLMMFWAWFNGSLYHELHGNYDLKTRVIIFAQMLCLIGMGIFIHSAFGEGYRGFSLFYGLFLTILTLLWWRTGVHDKEHKLVATPFVALFCLITVAFFVSIFTPQNISHIIWFGAVAFSLIFTMLAIIFPNKKAKIEQREAVTYIGESFVERFGLLTIIILGEGIISTIGGSTHIHHWNVLTVLNVIGCFALLVAIWWLFFDFISRKLPHHNNVAKSFWIGLHFPLMTSIGLFNAGILNLLEYVKVFTMADKLLIIIPLIVFLLCCMGLMKTVQIPNGFQQFYQKATHKMIVALIGLAVIIFLPVGKTATLWLAFACLQAPIFSSLVLWVKSQSEK